MRAAIYNPYLDTLGGGERYSMSVASILAKHGYQVGVEWKDNEINNLLKKRFDLNLDKVNIIKSIKRGEGYDICFWVSDGSIPMLKARNNILHFQSPFRGVNGRSLINRMKMFRINSVVVNSKFTKGYIDKEYGVDSIVVYPPTDVAKIKPKKKENVILSVGRFSQLKQAKRQDILIRTFKKLHDTGYKDWQLVLAGGTEVGVDNYLKKLKKTAKGYPISIIEGPDFSEIRSLYGKAKIFWTATGFGIDDTKEPEKAEHFGISIVEAMAAGAAVFALDAGGHREIIADRKNGYLWSDVKNLLSKTKRIIEDVRLYNKIARQAVVDSKNFGYEKFEKKLLEII